MRIRNTLSGSNNYSTKMRNRALALKIICTGANVSRVDISRQTGLSKMSISNIAGELISEGFVKEQDEQSISELIGSGGAAGAKNTVGVIGRKPIFLAPDTAKHIILGMYISRDYAAAALSNLKCEITDEKRCTFNPDESEGSFIKKIKSIIHEVLDESIQSGKKLLGIGVAAIGPLDNKNGIILEPPNFYTLKSIPIKKLLENEFSCPVYTDNDMNASALAEKLYGNGREVRSFAYLGVTNGIGAGIIADNALFEGDMGFGGEIGHTTINFEGTRCACGNTGCLELYASIPEILKQAENSIASGVDSALAEFENIKWIDIIKCAKAGDKLSISLIDRMCLYISMGLVNLINMFDPQTIYLGHDIAMAGSLVTERLQAYLKDKTISSKYKNVPVKISAFVDKAPIVGSVAIVLDRLFNAAIPIE